MMRWEQMPLDTAMRRWTSYLVLVTYSEATLSFLQIEDEMIQCVICEDWYHSRVSVVLEYPAPMNWHTRLQCRSSRHKLSPFIDITLWYRNLKKLKCVPKITMTLLVSLPSYILVSLHLHTSHASHILTITKNEDLYIVEVFIVC